MQKKQQPFASCLLAAFLALSAASGGNHLHAEEVEWFTAASALAFRGDGSYLEIDADAGDLGIDGNRDRTIELWVYMRDFQNNEGIFSLGTTGQGLQDFSLRVIDGRTNRFRGQFWGQDMDFSYNAKDKWVHVAVTHDGETRRIYADGDLVAEQSRELETSTEQNLRVGWWRGDNQGTLDGLVKELRVWNTARSESEIRDNMYERLTGDEDGLVGYWPMQEHSGDVVPDMAGEHDGRFVGNLQWTLALGFKQDLGEYKQVSPGETIMLGPVELYEPHGEVTYQWYRDGEPLEGATESSLKISDIAATDIGTYHVKIDDEREQTPIESRQKKLPPWPITVYEADWAETVHQVRTHSLIDDIQDLAQQFWDDFPIETDWLMQDSPGDMSEWRRGSLDGKDDLADLLSDRPDASLEKKLLKSVIEELHETDSDIATRIEDGAEELNSKETGPDDPRWLELYQQACRERRRLRLQPVLEQTREIIYVRRPTFGQQQRTIYLITENEGGHGRSALMELNLTPELAADGNFAEEEVIRSAPAGIRDPELSYDGKRLLFAQRVRGDYGTNYQIFEKDLENGEIRQLTTDETYGASFEPLHLPNGDILFSSSRIVAHTTCGWDDYSNLFLMNSDGQHARRVGFDQVHTGFSSMLEDGRILYTRRDYNDRGQVFTHALFTMNPDGTNQEEYYGNHTYQPTAFQHSREIPGTGKVLTILGAYHASQGGKLAKLDVNQGRQDDEGLTLIPCGSKPQADREESDLHVSDTRYGRFGEQYQYPYPITEDSFLVSHNPIGGHRFSDGHVHVKPEHLVRYGLYYMDFDGRRELLTLDPAISSLDAVPVMTRKKPQERASMVDYTQDYAHFTIEDIYHGRAIEGVERGTINKIRVVELEYKPTTIGGIQSPDGTAGYGHSITPVANTTGTYDVKRILGDATVYEDGSAYFKVPARRPIFFQALDEKNRAVQSMRSWTTSMPGEYVSCVGCHDSKQASPPASEVAGPTKALQAGPEKLESFYGPPRGFSFREEVQPILDNSCVSCHSPGGANEDIILTAEEIVDTGRGDNNPQRRWSKAYLQLTMHPHARELAWTRHLPYYSENEWINWIGRLSTPHILPPYSFGSTQSKLFDMLEGGHDGRVDLSREALDKIAAWIDLNIPYLGDYKEANAWSSRDKERYQNRMELREKMQEMERQNIKDLIESQR